MKEGFAAVDQRGNVTRVDQRVTGDLWHEIQQRLSGIDRSELASVAVAREVMKEASRATWAEQRHINRERTRPVTKIEKTIIDAATAANGDREQFDAAMEKAGLGLARVTSADLKAIDILQKDEQLTAAVDPAHKVRLFPALEKDQLAAVDRFGGVHRLNLHRLEEIKQRLTEPKPGSVIEAGAQPWIWTPLASVVELRAGFEEGRELREKFFAAIKEGAALDRQERATEKVTQHQERAANRAVRDVVGTAERAAVVPIAGAANLLDKGLSFVTRGFSALLKIQPLQILDLFDFGAGAPPSKEQVAQKTKAATNEETLHAHAYAAHTEAKEAEFDDRMHAQKTTQQETDLRKSQTLGTNPTAEANLGRDEDAEPERKRNLSL